MNMLALIAEDAQYETNQDMMKSTFTTVYQRFKIEGHIVVVKLWYG
jgi:hypothetical protein